MAPQFVRPTPLHEQTDDEQTDDEQTDDEQTDDAFLALDDASLLADLVLDDPVRAYLNEIGQTALLTAEQEVALARRLALGRAAAAQLRDEPDAPRAVCQALREQIADGQAARHHLIQANLRLVISIAKRYSAPGMTLMELIQEGNIGLMRAADKFDATRGIKFSTYATWWIRQGVNRGRQDQSRTMRLPVHVQEFLSKLHQTQHRLYQELQREARPEELASALGVRPEKVRQLLEAAQGVALFSTPTGQDADDEFGNLLPDEHAVAPDEAAEAQCLREDLCAAVAQLPERERRIIELRYGLHDGHFRTLEEIGVEFGITRERIRQIEVIALRKLRHPHLGKKLRGYAGGA